jgi:hypothetical protein
VPAAVGFSDHHGHLGHGCSGNAGGQVLIPVQDAAALGLGADQQTRDVLQEDDRQVERVAQVDERPLLVQRGGVQRAGADDRLAGDHADRGAVQAGEAGQDAGAPAITPRQDRPRVDDAADDLAHVVTAAGFGRHDVAQIGRVEFRFAGLTEWSGQPGVRGQVGQERRDRLERVVLALHHHVRVAGGLGLLRATEAGVIDPFADRLVDHDRAGQRERRRLGHHDEMGRRGVQCGVAVTGSEDGGGPRHGELAGTRFEERLEVQGQPGEAPAHDVGDPAAVGVAQQDDRQADPLRRVDQPALLAHARRRGRTGHDARVDTDHRDLAAVDPAVAGDHRVAGNRPVTAELRLGEQPHLEPGARVDHPFQALADGQPTGCVVLGNAVGSAHRQCFFPAAIELGQQLVCACTSQDHPLVLTIRIVN